MEEELKDEVTNDFDEGFDLATEGDNDPAGEGTKVGDEQKQDDAPAAGQDEPGQQIQEAQPVPAPVPYVPPVEQPQPAPMQQVQAPVQQVVNSAPKSVAIAEDIAEEFEELKRLNPQAAIIAAEDSEDGEVMRRRLSQYGADSALDRAEIIMSKRDDSRRDFERQQRAIEEHNTLFKSVVEREAPDFTAMCNDPSRAVEASEFVSSMERWIKAHPYEQAEGMMKVFKGGRDPHEVAQLINNFSKARGTKVAADPSAALAVPKRGAPVAPKGVGSKDDFDAGWNMSD